LTFEGAAFSFLVSLGVDFDFSCSEADLFLPANLISPSFSYFPFFSFFFEGASTALGSWAAAEAS
jgi:hypothetical protein